MVNRYTALKAEAGVGLGEGASVESRCMNCGKDMNADDMAAGGKHCMECADGDMDESGMDAEGPRPGGWSRMDNKPPANAEMSHPANYKKIPTFAPPKPKGKKTVEMGVTGEGGGGSAKSKGGVLTKAGPAAASVLKSVKK